MSILAGYIVPHPPIIIPAVGKGQEAEISATQKSYEIVAAEIARLAPETIVILSPHSTVYADYIHISPGSGARGSFSRFGDNTVYKADYDRKLIETLTDLCESQDFPAGILGERDKNLDHGTLIPLHFIQGVYKNFKIIRIGISGLSLIDHYRFGMLLKTAVERLGRKAVVIASGDLSHKLKEDGPYGFVPEGPVLDKRLTEIMAGGNLGEFLELDPALCEAAAECGLRGFAILAGALHQKAVAPRLLSYEGTFGVGYAVAAFPVTGEDPARDFLSVHEKRAAQRLKEIRNREDPLVRLARETLETYIITGRRPKLPPDLPQELTKRRAGCFVSIKKDGNLRGCIGTIEATRENLAQEIAQNAVSAGTGDPRFPPVRESELDDLIYSVDVLGAPEPVSDKSALDPKRYGVIVTAGYRRGLLLPDLEGVDSVSQQLEIACRKAGIDPDEPYEIERFEVVRHT